MQYSDYCVSEPFLESVPQLYVLLMLAFESGNYWRQDESRIIDINSSDSAIFVAFALSLISGSFGIAKFIKAGPTGIVDKGKPLDGFVTMTFILIYFNVGAILLGRVCALGMLIANFAEKGSSKSSYLLVLLSFLPQFVHVSWRTNFL